MKIVIFYKFLWNFSDDGNEDERCISEYVCAVSQEQTQE